MIPSRVDLPTIVPQMATEDIAVVNDVQSKVSSPLQNVVPPTNIADKQIPNPIAASASDSIKIPNLNSPTTEGLGDTDNLSI